MMTFKRLARTKQYALGKDSPSSFITSAMQMVADRETPTLQWTKVAVPALRPFSVRRSALQHLIYTLKHLPMNSRHLSNCSVSGSTPLS